MSGVSCTCRIQPIQGDSSAVTTHSTCSTNRLTCRDTVRACSLEAQIWIPILSRLKPNAKLILAGDHLQLPPTVLGRKPPPRTAKKKRDSAKSKQGDKDGREEKESREESAAKAEVGGESGEESSGSSSRSAAESDTELAFEAFRLVVETEALNGDPSPSADSRAETREDVVKGPAFTKRTRLRPPRSLETTMFSRLLGMYGTGIRALLNEQVSLALIAQAGGTASAQRN